MKAGKPRAEAIAIALSVARRRTEVEAAPNGASFDNRYRQLRFVDVLEGDLHAEVDGLKRGHFWSPRPSPRPRCRSSAGGSGISQ